MAVSMREIERTIGDTERPAIRCDFAQTRDHLGLRPIRRQFDLHLDRTEDFQRRGEGCGIEDECVTIVGSLVDIGVVPEAWPHQAPAQLPEVCGERMARGPQLPA